MGRTHIHRAIQRGVGLALSLATPTFVGCGGQTDSCGITSNQPTAGGTCYGQSFSFHGSAATCGADSFGALAPDQCKSLCPLASGSTASRCDVSWTTDPGVLNCDYPVAVSPGGCGVGRRPSGLCPPSSPVARTPAGRLLAEIAHLEAASVHAFAVLARELEEHGAPPRLRAKSLGAARDEIRHSIIMKEFAESAGARVEPVCIEHCGRRTLEAMALENAVEGCVGETYGAAVAHIQANRAADPRVRAAMKRIAADETRHAELSFELARWFDKKLNPAGRRRVRDARQRAAQALARTVVPAAVDTTSSAELGLPTPEQTAALINELRRSLWT